MQICTLLTRIQCKVSDIQVTVKACGPLVKFTHFLHLYYLLPNASTTRVVYPRFLLQGRKPCLKMSAIMIRCTCYLIYPLFHRYKLLIKKHLNKILFSKTKIKKLLFHYQKKKKKQIGKKLDLLYRLIRKSKNLSGFYRWICSCQYFFYK